MVESSGPALVIYLDPRDLKRGDLLRMADQANPRELQWRRVEAVTVRFGTSVLVEFVRPGSDKLGAMVYDLPVERVEVARLGIESQPRRWTRFWRWIRRGRG